MTLRPEDEDLLSKARHGLGPSARDRARVRAALVAGLAATMAPTAAAAVGGMKVGLGFKLVGLAVVTLAISGAAVVSRSTPPTTGRAAERALEPPPASVVAAPPPVPALEDVPPPVETIAAPLPKPRKRVASVAPPAPAASMLPEPTVASGALGEETKLVSAANAALRAGDGRAALAAIEDHQRRFPAGVLAEERDAQRVEAMCLAGQTAEARERAARFGRDRPGSPLLTKVKAACSGKKL